MNTSTHTDSLQDYPYRNPKIPPPDDGFSYLWDYREKAWFPYAFNDMGGYVPERDFERHIKILRSKSLSGIKTGHVIDYTDPKGTRASYHVMNVAQNRNCIRLTMICGVHGINPASDSPQTQAGHGFTDGVKSYMGDPIVIDTISDGVPDGEHDEDAPRSMTISFDAEWIQLKVPAEVKLGDKKEWRYRIILSYQFAFRYRGKTFVWLYFPKYGMRAKLSKALGYLLQDTAAWTGFRHTMDYRTLNERKDARKKAEEDNKARKEEGKKPKRLPGIYKQKELKDIVLVGHFDIVDIAAFWERDKILERLDAIGRTLVSLEKPLWLRAYDDSYHYLTPLVITVRDTMKLLPADYQSLEKAGQAVGEHKLELPEGFDKGNMEALLLQRPDAFIAYAAQDAVTTLKVWEEVSQGTLEPTLGAKAAQQVKASIMAQHGWEKDCEFDQGWRGLEREVQADNPGVKGSTALVVSSRYSAAWALASEAFYGGRNEGYSFGLIQKPGRIFSDYDLSGAYPSAMSLLPDIDWEQDPKPLMPGELSESELNPTDFWFAIIDFAFSDNTPYPCIPIRDPGGAGLIFPLQGKAVPASAPEVWLALRMGAKVVVRHGFRLPVKPVYSLANALVEMVKRRKELTKGTMPELAQKTINNSVYGKLGQGLKGKRDWDMRKKCYRPTPPSPITQPFYACMTTGLIRAALGATLDGISRIQDRIIVSATTDGLISDATMEEITGLDKSPYVPGAPLLELMRKTKKEWFGEDGIWECKHWARAVLSMRTRGQIGIPDEHGKPPIAKAGYRASVGEDLVELFINRDGYLVFAISRLPAPREYSVKNADAQSIQQQRRVSWEYDHKRELSVDTAVMQTLVLDDQTISHVSIPETRPWRSMDDFYTARRALVAGRPPVPVKTIEDATAQARRLEAFKAAREAQRYVPADEDGGVARLWATSILRGLRQGMLKAAWMPDPEAYGAGAEAVRRISEALGIKLVSNDWKMARRGTGGLVLAGAGEILEALGITLSQTLKPA